MRPSEYGIFTVGRFCREGGPESLSCTHWLRVPMIDLPTTNNELPPTDNELPPTDNTISPFSRLDGIMVMAAHRYCLRRRTYIALACIEWLTQLWPTLESVARQGIVCDTVGYLRDINIDSMTVDDMTYEMSDTTQGWLAFANWAFPQLDEDARIWVRQQVAP